MLPASPAVAALAGPGSSPAMGGRRWKASGFQASGLAVLGSILEGAARWSLA